MSHLAPANLLGGGGGTDAGDFDFADLPEDDDEDVPPDYEFDAVNDETFGMDVSSVVHNDFEMEHYAEQTADLSIVDERPSTSQIQLGDNGQLWVQAMLEASVSNLLDDADDAPSAPPAHYLPMPAFGEPSGGFSPGAKPARQRLERFMDNINQSTAPAPFFLDIGTVDTIWGKSGGSHSPEKPNGAATLAPRAEVDYRRAVSTGDENRAPPSALNNNQIMALLQQMQVQENQRAAAGRSPLRGAVTLEEVERQAQRSSPKPRVAAPMTVEELERSILQQQRQKAQTPPQKRPMTVEELERHLRTQAPPPAAARQISSPLPVTGPPPGLQQQMQSGRCPPMNVPPPLWMNPQVRAALMAHIAAGKPLPPGFPPPAAFMRSPIGPHPHPGQRMPMGGGGGGGMPPPPQWGSPGRPPMGMQQRPPMGAHLIRMQPMNQYFREQQLKRAGLPSGKTISDFAFDPYAGLMSRKEREWLVKIQGLQLQGSGNPYNDDYYYTLWKQKKLALERQEQGLKPLHASELETEHTETTPYNYVPPTFAGSLGKPTLSTANFPRQLIDLRARQDSIADDDSITGSSATPSVEKQSGLRRFKALLIEVEHGWTVLLECEDRHRQLAAGSTEEANRALLATEIRIRLTQLCESLCGPRLSSVVSLKKGRELLSRVVRQADKDQASKLIGDFVVQLVALAKKDGAGEMQLTLFPAIFDAFKRLAKEHLTSIWEQLNVDEMKAAFETKNMFPQSLLLLLVSYSARKRLPASGSPAVADWFRLASTATPSLTAVPWLSNDHLKIMRHWLVTVLSINDSAVDQYMSTLSAGL
uniref:mRNA decay factor PAT1 domain-containing protein n=1 Tax=Plectus sambesii TaxID=2011161 RepID=A0A914XDW5_9BILA